VEDDEDEDVGTGLSDVEPCHKSQSQQKQKARRFRNEDLPGLPMTGAPFCDLIIPRWIFYYSSLNSVWKLAIPQHVAHVQKLWNETFLNVPCTVTLHDDPIFALVCILFHPTPILTHFKVKQWTYDWRGDLAAHAHKAVKAFFDCYENFVNAVDRADYVKWAVPEVMQVFNSRGDPIPVAPNLFPYMWASIENGPDRPVSY